MIVMTIFLLAVTTAVSVAQSQSKGPVKVKIVRIVDGDTTTIEQTMNETSVQDFTKQFQNIKGKNVQVMITVEDLEKDKKDKNRSAQSMHFNFDMDSSSAHSFAKAFVFSDSAFEKHFTWNDSMLKNFPKNFDFKFDFDDEGMMHDFNFDFNIDTDKDGKAVIIKNGKGKTIVIKGDEDNARINMSEDDNGRTRTKTKTIVIGDENGKNKKKVIVSTSVVVIDIDDEKDDVYKSDRKKSKEETNFSFYPNPSDGNFILDLEMNGKDDAQVKITDMNGKVVYSEKISGNSKVSKSIDLSGKKGTFIVTIKQGKKITSKKIIIE